MTAAFTHLHLHTEFSLLDGAIRIKELPERLKELGMTACAITDHGAMYGIIDFYLACRSAGIKPILGCEVYVAPRARTDKEAGVDKEPSHLVLLAENEAGFKNLMKLVSAGFVEGFYYHPRVDAAMLEENAEGLIALSACLGGEIPKSILNGDLEKAEQVARRYQSWFGPDHFYLEIQNNGIADQNRVNAELIKLSARTGIPLVATNDCHYMNKSDAKAHEVLLCVQTGKRMTDEDRMRLPTSEFYVKSPEEMQTAFSSFPEAIANTARIAERCNVELDFNRTLLPTYYPPDELDSKTYLRDLCRKGLDYRLANGSEFPLTLYEERVETELRVINEMGFTDYFLIVWDFIDYARRQDIMVGPGRGSGTGSLVAYCLGITNIDPLKYDLIFERFLNPERVSMPDFDIDFCYERRQEVIDYVTAKYGTDHVAQVITFGTMAARAAVNDVARALNYPYDAARLLTKSIPAELEMTLKKALDRSPEFKQAYDQDAMAHEIIDVAMRLEGLPRHASTHAAGVVISSEPLTRVAPLSRNDDAIVVQYAKNNVELIGLLKFDFLGLRTLTVMRDAAAMIEQNHGVVIDYDRLPMDDRDVYKMIGEGRTEAVFQLESPGMTSFMQELKPNSLEDVIAGVSLYRPGPMESIPRYVAAKHDPSLIHYDHPLLEPILNVTYGCVVYQEQVMRIVRDVAGFSMGQSDNVRRAMSKKKPDELAKYRNLFVFGGNDEHEQSVTGAVARGVPEKVAVQIFEHLMAFAGYAFTKSHAAAYAVVAYTTGWLKYHYPVEFMAAMLNSFIGSGSKQAAHYVRIAQRMNIEVLTPDVNRSGTKFLTEGGKIRFSLAAVKNVGTGMVADLVAEREENGPFVTYGTFLRRMATAGISKKSVESMVRAGACDAFDLPRSQMVAVIDLCFAQEASLRKSRLDGQISLFESSSDTSSPDLFELEPTYPDIPEFGQALKLSIEKELLGFYLSGHPLGAYSAIIEQHITVDSAALTVHPAEETDDESMVPQAPRLRDGQRIVMAGLVLGQKNKTTRKNELMCFLTMEDLAGEYEAVVFPRTLREYGAFIQPDAALLLEGAVNFRAAAGGQEETEGQITVQRVSPLDSMTVRQNSAAYEPPEPPAAPPVEVPAMADEPDPQTGPVLILRYLGEQDDDGYRRLLSMLGYFRGHCPVRIYLEPTGQMIALPSVFSVEVSNEILSAVAAQVGIDNMALTEF